MPAVSKRRGRSREAAIVAVSALAHVLALLLLGLTTPALRTTLRDAPAVIPLEIWTPPPTVAARRSPTAAAASPSPLRTRSARAPSPRAVVAPLPLAPVQAPAPPAQRPAVAGIAPPAQTGGDLRRALRGSTVGCANRDAVGLTLREREGCDDRYAKGRENDAFIEPPIEPGKRAAWDAAAARKERARRRKEAPPPTGINPADNAGGTKTNGIGILGY